MSTLQAPPPTIGFQFFGPVEVTGARGTRPQHRVRRCEELLAFVLLHPGLPSAAVSDAMSMARQTVKSMASHLRSWLGTDEAGEPFLAAGGDGYRVSPAVTSDWHQLQALTDLGVDQVPDVDLVAGLKGVRGPVLASALPGEYLFCESIRSWAPILVGDVAGEVTTRALDRGDLRTARWATGVGLEIDPGSERLLVDRVRVEHAAANHAEVARLVRVLRVQADSLGVELDEATLEVLARVR